MWRQRWSKWAISKFLMDDGKMSTSLYVIANEYVSACEKLSELDLPAEVVADTLESLSGDLEDKAINVAAFLRGLEETAASIKNAEISMKKRREQIEKRAETLREYLLSAMKITGVKKIKSPYFDLSIRLNPPVVEIEKAELIPPEFLRIPDPKPPEPDKKKIAETIKSGVIVPGAKLTQHDRLLIS